MNNMKAWCLAFILYFLLIPLGRVIACGEILELPVNYFPSINEDGLLSYWQQIGRIEVEATSLPLIVNFKPNRQLSSAYAGTGWALFPFDANIVQLSENQFLLVRPDGLNMYFMRSKDNPNLLRGPGTWVAEIKADTITAKKECGWIFEYYKGKLRRVANSNNDFIFNRDQYNRVTDILNNGILVGKVYVDNEGTTARIECSGTTLNLSQDVRPNIQRIGAQLLLNHLERSLSKVRNIEKNQETIFDYGLTKENFPIFSSSSLPTSILKWDPESGKLLNDGKWSYETSSIDGITSQKRISIEGKSEGYILDIKRGVSMITTINGYKFTQHVLSLGLFGTKIRRIDEEFQGKSKTVYSCSYNEMGQKIREVKDGVLTQLIDTFDVIKSSDIKAIRNGSTTTFTFQAHGRESNLVLNEKNELVSRTSMEIKDAKIQK